MRFLIVVWLVFFSALAVAAPTWQVISVEPGRRIEIDRVSMKREEGNRIVVLARLVLDKEINDPASGGTYRIIESLTRYECVQRNAANLRRTYRKSETELLRDEELKGGSLPVRANTLDEKVLREVCRPEGSTSAEVAVGKVNEAALALKQANRALLERTRMGARAAKKKGAAKAVTSMLAPRIEWGYSGEGAPDRWHALDPGFALCGSGQRQSPIDIRDAIRVDLTPIVFHYRPVPFRIRDNGHTIEAMVDRGFMVVDGRRFDLKGLQFRRPSEEMVNGQRTDMSVHLIHESNDGQLAVLAVLLEKGAENPLVQTLWNNLPLEKKWLVSPSGQSIDPNALLPVRRDYATYMGSLTTPPCTEGVLWLVLKQPVTLSQAQIDIFTRFYLDNARPVQPTFGRVIKEDRQ